MDSKHEMMAWFICFLIILSLFGCGGGGGDSTTPPENIPPIANAGLDQTLTLSSPDTRTLTLTGTSSDSDGSVVSHQWVQTEGPAVTLSGAATATITFTVGAATQVYSFNYTVADNDGAQQTDTVSVFVTQIIFSDSFPDDTSDSNWNFTNDDTTNNAMWTSNGQLRQSAYIAQSALEGATSFHLGSYALLTAIYNLSDYRFSVDITPLTNNNSAPNEGNDVGIMFRYVDEDNYYRVSMSARYGFTRFEKRTGGTFETLAVNARGYVENQTITMTAEVSGDTIIVWIDGDPVFAVVDTDIPSGTVALYCQDRAWFDNVEITENPLQPTVAISTPLAYSIALTPGDADTLDVWAVALNPPNGGNVGLILDDGSEMVATTVGNVYSAQFTGVAGGEHEIMAVLRGADGLEVSRDINSTVGIGGNYILTVGASITNGVGDDDSSNNETLDGRIIAIQGFQAPLADALTNTTGLPQIVFNEGIGGDLASELNIRIDSILDRHPGANKVLLMIGTNDAGSGVLPDDFEDDVVETANSIIVAGKQVWLAEILPTYIEGTFPSNPTLNETMNARIREYNLKIQSITGADSNDDSFLGPDFYNAFLNMDNLYQDYLHPNDSGYGVMADEWQDTLTAP